MPRQGGRGKRRSARNPTTVASNALSGHPGPGGGHARRGMPHPGSSGSGSEVVRHVNATRHRSVDGDILCELLRDLKLGVTTRLVPEIEIVEGFFQEI